MSNRPIPLARFDRWDHDRQRRAIEEYAAQRADHLDRYRELVEHLRPTRSDVSEHERELYRLAVAHLYVDELTHLDLVMLGRVLGDPVVHGDSFWRKIVERRRKKQLGPVPEKWLGIRKDRDHAFAKLAGARQPRRLFAGRFRNIPDRLQGTTAVVVKPARSSEGKGVFLVFGPDDMFAVSTSQTVRSWEDLRAETQRQLGTDDIDNLAYEVQELVVDADGRPARDLKFYAFYGRIGLVIEIVRHPILQYAYFDDELRLISSGKNQPPFVDPTATTVDRGGLDEERLETVRRLSEAIPAPFMRVDFFDGVDGLVFGEMSSAPGMSHEFAPAHDGRLGRMYLEAEMRLTDDLLAGKRFEVFERFCDRYPFRAAAAAEPVKLGETRSSENY